MLSGCISGGDGGSGDGNGSRQGENGDSGDDGSGDSGFTPWISPYGDPQKTRSTPDPAPTDLESTTSYRVGGSVAVTDAGVFTLDRAVSRVDPSAGEIAFNRSVPVGRALFVQDGIVVCGERAGSGRVAGVDAETGERAWLVEPGGTVVPFPAGDGIGYAGSHIGVLDPASGDTRWDRDRAETRSSRSIERPARNSGEPMVVSRDETRHLRSMTTASTSRMGPNSIIAHPCSHSTQQTGASSGPHRLPVGLSA